MLRRFVIQAGELNGLRAARREFTLHMHVFESPDVASAVIDAFRQLYMAGLVGGKWEATAVAPEVEPCELLTVDFLTPIELEWRGGAPGDRVAAFGCGTDEWA